MSRKVSQRLDLQCVDCGLRAEGEPYDILERMQRHTREAHGRDLKYRHDFYLKGEWTANEMLASIALLRPEFCICA